MQCSPFFPRAPPKGDVLKDRWKTFFLSFRLNTPQPFPSPRSQAHAHPFRRPMEKCFPSYLVQSHPEKPEFPAPVFPHSRRKISPVPRHYLLIFLTEISSCTDVSLRVVPPSLSFPPPCLENDRYRPPDFCALLPPVMRMASSRHFFFVYDGSSIPVERE